MLGFFGVILAIGTAILLQSAEVGIANLLPISLSELGTYSRSPSALILNGGIFFSGLTMALACLFAMQLSPKPWGALFWITFALMFVAFAATGLFPMNVYHLHLHAITAYISFGVLSSCYCLLYCFSMPKNERLLIMGLALTVCLIQVTQILLPQYFAWVTGRDFTEYKVVVDSITSKPPQPAVWWQAMLMWLSVLFNLFWLLAMLRQMSVNSASLAQNKG